MTKHTYLYFKGSPYGAAPLITPFCIPEKVDFLGEKLSGCLFEFCIPKWWFIGMDSVIQIFYQYELDEAQSSMLLWKVYKLDSHNNFAN